MAIIIKDASNINLDVTPTVVTTSISVRQDKDNLTFCLKTRKVSMYTGIKGLENILNLVGRDYFDNVIFNGQTLNEKGVEKFWSEFDRILK